MKRNKSVVKGSIPFILVLVVITSIFFNTSMYKNRTNVLEVKKGVLTIPRNIEDEVFFLEGEFYFTPNRFNCIKNPDKLFYATLPSSLQDSPLSSNFGCACYGLHIEGLNPNLIYSLRIPQAFSSTSIFVDNKEKGVQGKLAKSKEEEVPSVRSSEAIFRSRKDGSADIVINISNFTQRKSGFFSRFILSESGRMSRLFRTDLIFSASIFATIFTVSIFLLFLFFFYSQAKFLLWFSLACMTLAIRETIFYPHLASYIFHEMTWHVHFILRYITFPLPVLFFTVFLKKTVKICIKIPYILVLSITGIYVLSLLLLPPTISNNLVRYYQGISVFCILYDVAILFYALVKKYKYALWIFIGTMLLVMFGFYDLLVATSYIQGAYFAPAASLFSIIILSIMTLNMYSTSMEKVEELRLESKEIHASLSRFVPEQIVSLLGKKSIKDIAIGDHIESTMPILSADIRAFTKTTEKLSSQDVFDYLNKYFALIVPIIRAHNGVIPKYLGDGIFALFPDGSSSAVQCAIEIQKTLAENRIIARSGDELKVGIGIDSARVLLGTIGNDKRMDVILISTAYKNSETIQSATKKYASPIIISSNVFARLEAGEKVFARPIQLVKNANEKQNLLYEVYASESEEIKFLKNRAQTYLVEAFDAICKSDAKTAFLKFSAVAEIFPQDIVAKEYLAMFRAKIKQ